MEAAVLTVPLLQDILNNLDSCDLEDDDLMLDVDLPEDTPRDKGKAARQSHCEMKLHGLERLLSCFLLTLDLISHCTL